MKRRCIFTLASTDERFVRFGSKTSASIAFFVIMARCVNEARPEIDTTVDMYSVCSFFVAFRAFLAMTWTSRAVSRIHSCQTL
jgi:hypothetical protein